MRGPATGEPVPAFFAGHQSTVERAAKNLPTNEPFHPPISRFEERASPWRVARRARAAAELAQDAPGLSWALARSAGAQSLTRARLGSDSWISGLTDAFPCDRAQHFSGRGPAVRRGSQVPVVEQGHTAPVEVVLLVQRRQVVYQDGANPRTARFPVASARSTARSSSASLAPESGAGKPCSCSISRNSGHASRSGLPYLNAATSIVA